MLFVNQSDAPVYLPIGRGGMRVASKGTIEIPDGYAHPRRYDNGSRRPSVVEELAGSDNGVHKLVPADPQQRVDWLKAPPARRHDPKVANMPTVEGYVASGVPRGQAEILVKQAHQAVIDALNSKDDAKPVAKDKK